jgi:hypothetical protein
MSIVFLLFNRRDSSNAACTEPADNPDVSMQSANAGSALENDVIAAEQPAPRQIIALLDARDGHRYLRWLPH